MNFSCSLRPECAKIILLKLTKVPFSYLWKNIQMKHEFESQESIGLSVSYQRKESIRIQEELSKHVIIKVFSSCLQLL